MGRESVPKDSLEKYDVIELPRSVLKNASYNPRKITDKARAKLKKNIARIGLLQPLIWNESTGNLLQGHQRLQVLDGLYGTKDYTLKVARVRLTEKEEKAQNVFMNNPEAMGDWDLEKLESLMKDGLEVEESGFDLGEAYRLFGDSPMISQPEKIVELSEQLRAARDTYEEMVKAGSKKNNEDFYLVVVFKNHAERKAFTESIGEPDNRYVDGKVVQVYLVGKSSGDAVGG